MTRPTTDAEALQAALDLARQGSRPGPSQLACHIASLAWSMLVIARACSSGIEDLEGLPDPKADRPKES